MPALHAAWAPPASRTRASGPAIGTFPHPEVVPYITRWSGEEGPDQRVVIRNGRLAYADERPYDRDSTGVLWMRIPSRPGKGRPHYGKVHSLRQRLAMTELLCQVCGGPADRTPDGVLWLIGNDPDEAPGTALPSDLHTTHPPVCLPCAHQSVHACPHLRRAYTAIRARAFHPAGVHGMLYAPALPTPIPTVADGIAYDDPRIRWTRAGQLIMRLDHFTVIDLADPEVGEPDKSARK